MRKRTDLTNKVFHNLTVTGFSFIKNNRHYWNCKCICGKSHIANTSALKSGDTKSCGCIKSQAIKDAKTTHGLSKIREYEVWQKMKYRCYNPNDKSYKNYGARGITVCKRWVYSFENFIKDMGLRPSNNHSLERKNNNGNYSKSNCKWATRVEQNSNKRNNIYFSYNGQKKILTHWAKLLTVTPSHLQYHLKTKNFPTVYNYFTSKLLGHTDLKSTAIYYKISPLRIDDELKKLE